MQHFNSHYSRSNWIYPHSERKTKEKKRIVCIFVSLSTITTMGNKNWNWFCFDFASFFCKNSINITMNRPHSIQIDENWCKIHVVRSIVQSSYNYRVFFGIYVYNVFVVAKIAKRNNRIADTLREKKHFKN